MQICQKICFDSLISKFDRLYQEVKSYNGDEQVLLSKNTKNEEQKME